jgi:DNA-binding CsgD family transcriptional regulator
LGAHLRIADLKEGEKSCLRLVAQGLTSKEIAKELDLSPATVDTYLKLATAKMQGQNRRDAARIFVQFEQSQLLGSQPEPLVLSPASAPSEVSTDADAPSKPQSEGWNWRAVLPPSIGGKINDRTAPQRIGDAFKIAFWSVVAFLIIILFLSQAIKALS